MDIAEIIEDIYNKYSFKHSIKKSYYIEYSNVFTTSICFLLMANMFKRFSWHVQVDISLKDDMEVNCDLCSKSIQSELFPDHLIEHIIKMMPELVSHTI